MTRPFDRPAIARAAHGGGAAEALGALPEWDLTHLYPAMDSPAFAADVERASLLEESETCTDVDRLGEVHERLLAIDAYTAPARAAKILSGLGFDEEMQHRPLSSFSGGWKMRVALGALLFSEPDILLLDEPLSNLDAKLRIQNFQSDFIFIISSKIHYLGA